MIGIGGKMITIDDLNEICIKRIGIDYINNEKLMNTSFFSKEICGDPREVMLLILDVEKKLGIRITDQYFQSPGLKSIQILIDYINIYL